MLCVKPICFRGGHAEAEEGGESELTDLRGIGEQQPLTGAAGGPAARGRQEEAMARREGEYKQIEMQLQEMGAKHSGHTFTEAFIH